jgi:hypothetical protein
MEYKELIELIREIFPKDCIEIKTEEYLHEFEILQMICKISYISKLPHIYIKLNSDTKYSMMIKNQRIGTIAIPHMWEIKFPVESNIFTCVIAVTGDSPNFLKVPDQNIKEFIILVSQKLNQYEILHNQMDHFYKDLEQLKTNPQSQIRNYKLTQLVQNESYINP